MHQAAYASAFGAATRVILAPLGRVQIAGGDALDLDRLAEDLGPKASVATSADAIVETIAQEARAGDTVALLSNGAFGGVPGRLVAALGARSPAPAGERLP